MDDQLRDELRAIHAKLDRLLQIVEDLRGKKLAKAQRAKTSREKPPAMTEEEVKASQGQFVQLFERWSTGDEVEVLTELEKMDVEQLRRFADANNLNVTSKMPAQKVMQLIGARFREKRQLLGGLRRQPDSSK